MPDKYGFNQFGTNVNTCTRFDEDGFDINGINRFTKTKYDKNGWDRNGKNKYTRSKYDKNGFDKDGWDKKGFYRDGYNKDGFNKKGINRFTRTKYDKNGYDIKGFDKDGYNKDGYDRKGNRDKDYANYIYHETYPLAGTFQGSKDAFIDACDEYNYYHPRKRLTFQEFKEQREKLSEYQEEKNQGDSDIREILEQDDNQEFVCNSCGWTVGKEDKYCSQCGNRLIYNEDVEYDEKESIVEQDTNGFYEDGWDDNGINKITGNKYDKDGFDWNGWNKHNFNRDGINKITRTKYDENGFDINGIHKDTKKIYDKFGYDWNGLHKNNGRDGEYIKRRGMF